MLIRRVEGPWEEWKSKLAALEKELIDRDIEGCHAEILAQRVMKVLMLLNMVRWGNVSLATASEWASDEKMAIGNYPGWKAMMELQVKWQQEGKWIRRQEITWAMQASAKEIEGKMFNNETGVVGDVCVCVGEQDDNEEGGKDYA